MEPKKRQKARAEIWKLARQQHGVVTRAQLLERGFSSDAIKHRIATGRLHPLWRGVYALGRPEVSEKGRWMAAVLCCGADALLSHGAAAVLWELVQGPSGIDVVVPEGSYRRRPGIRVHRRSGLGPEHRCLISGIPVTDPVSTLVDLASKSPEWKVERAINSADRLGLVDVETLRATVDLLTPRPGLGYVRRLLGGQPLTDSGLERRFLAIVRLAGMKAPETQAWVDGYRVDFYWPSLRLIVETDGWRYHRTPGAQAKDYRRDQTHTASGLTTLRFAEEQIRNEPQGVRETLVTTADRLAQSASA